MEQARKKNLKLYVVEHQEIFSEVYRTILPSRAPLELLRVSSNGDAKALSAAVAELEPDVILLSTRKLDVSVIEELEKIRGQYPGIGLVILLLFCSAQDVDMLRRLALIGEGGMALFLKQSLDEVDQLCQTIISVGQGQVILDPPLATFIFAGRPENPFLKQLTARELEILSLLAKGYTNAAIAGTLFIDIKTVEHHLNSMYSKLKSDPDFTNKHLRVSAARVYLETMGEVTQKESLMVGGGVR